MKKLFFLILLFCLSACSTSPVAHHNKTESQSEFQAPTRAGRSLAGDKSAELRGALINSYLKLAANLAQSRSADGQSHVCDLNLYESEITGVLWRAFNLTEDRVKFSKEVSSKSQIGHALKHSLVYREMTGDFSPENGNVSSATWQKVLVGTRFWGPAMGVYGSVVKFEVLADGKIAWHSLDIDQEMPKIIDSFGTWTIKTSPTTKAPLLSISLKGTTGKLETTEYQIYRGCGGLEGCSWYLTKPMKSDEYFEQEHIRFWNAPIDECSA